MDEQTHLEAARWWWRSVAAPADPAVAHGLEAWLAADLRHRLAFAECASLGYALDQCAEALAVVRPVARRPRLLYRCSALVLATLLCALGWFWLPGMWQDWQSDAHTGVGRIQTFDLADGSQLTLDSDSAVQFDLNSVDGRRLSLLRGALHVQVAPDPARPLTVHAEALQVTAVGTAFSVRRSPGTLLVDHGQVRVRGGDGQPLPGVPDLLVAGQQLSLGASGSWQLADVPAAAPDWTSRQRIHHAVPLRDVLVDLDRYLEGRLWLRAGPVLEQPVSAVLDLNDPEQALRALCAAHGLAVHAWLPGLRSIESP